MKCEVLNGKSNVCRVKVVSGSCLRGNSRGPDTPQAEYSCGKHFSKAFPVLLGSEMYYLYINVHQRALHGNDSDSGQSWPFKLLTCHLACGQCRSWRDTPVAVAPSIFNRESAVNATLKCQEPAEDPKLCTLITGTRWQDAIRRERRARACCCCVSAARCRWL